MKEDFLKKVSEKEELILHGGKVGEFAKGFTGDIDYIGYIILDFAYGKNYEVEEKGMDFFDKYAVKICDTSISGIRGYPELKVMGIDTSNVLTDGFRRQETNLSGIWVTKLYSQQFALDFDTKIAEDIVKHGESGAYEMYKKMSRKIDANVITKIEAGEKVNLHLNPNKMYEYIQREILGKDDYWSLSNMEINKELYEVAKKDPILQLVELLKKNNYDKEVVKNILRRRRSDFCKILYMNDKETMGCPLKNNFLEYFNNRFGRSVGENYVVSLDGIGKAKEESFMKEAKKLKGIKELDYYPNEAVSFRFSEILSINALIEEMCFRTNV